MIKPIGVLGGSFDPIHAGHLQLARDALKHLPLREVRFMPAAQPWQKSAITPAEHRATMVKLAIDDEPRFALDMHEIERGGPTYTVDTLRDWRRAQPDQPLVLILGSDQLARFDTWRDWLGILELAHLAVAQRAGVTDAVPAEVQAVVDARRAEPSQLTDRASGCIVEFPMTPVNVSATEVRRLLQQRTADVKQRLSAMVPTKVLDYIQRHRLYGTG